MLYNEDMYYAFPAFAAALFLAGCSFSGAASMPKSDTMKPSTQSAHDTQPKNRDDYPVATFAGGCFWCMEPAYQEHAGVVDAVVGFSGGAEVNPTYLEVGNGTTGHFEVVRVWYDPQVVSYNELLEIFWRQIDPTDDGGQFADRGPQYRTAIFYHTDEQKRLAEISKENLDASGKFDTPIVTQILPAGAFYMAEEYHQDFYKHSAERYGRYKKGSGRKGYIEDTWATESQNFSTGENTESSSFTPPIEQKMYTKPSDAEIKNMLTELQYNVTQKEKTERPFENEYWDNKEPGIYVDIVSGEPLFSSLDKYESGTGWPSFVKPLEPDNIVEERDFKLLLPRTEVRSKHGDSHLGHVFTDGPEDRGGLRYCLNSAALRFIPADKLEEEGYGEYGGLFE